LRLGTNGVINEFVTMPHSPSELAFDGRNVWVSHYITDSVTKAVLD